MKNLNLEGMSLENVQNLAFEYNELRQDLKNQNFFYFKEEKFSGESYRGLFEANVVVMKIIDDCLGELNETIEGGLKC